MIGVIVGLVLLGFVCVACCSGLAEVYVYCACLGSVTLCCD